MNHNIGIIGGGVAGIGTALELADAGYKVILYEEKDELLKGSSHATPGRLGLGFHYSHIPTAIQYLSSTINFIKTYEKRFYSWLSKNNLVGSFRIKKDDAPAKSYYIYMKDSLFSKEDILKVNSAIELEYNRLILLDNTNEVLGNPKDLVKKVNLTQLSHIINVETVDFAVETAEGVLNWELFRQFLLHETYERKNITIKTNHSITSISKKSPIGFLLNNEFYHDLIINSSWHNIEWMENLAGINTQKTRINRVKFIAKIKLPKSLRKLKSLFFCFGPHCSFTNLQNGTGYITYEPITNINHHGCKEVKLHSDLLNLLENNPEEHVEIKIELAKKVFCGVSKYILPFKKIVDNKNFDSFFKEIYLDGRFGVVRNNGYIDFKNANSSHHKRNTLEINSPQIGWINNPSMKLLYFQENAKVISRLVSDHLKTINFLKNINSNYDIDNIENYKREIAEDFFNE